MQCPPTCYFHTTLEAITTFSVPDLMAVSVSLSIVVAALVLWLLTISKKFDRWKDTTDSNFILLKDSVRILDGCW